jgi:hypothetical protein
MTEQNHSPRKSPFVKWLIPVVVFLSLLAVFAASHKNPAEDPSATGGADERSQADGTTDEPVGPVDLSEFGPSKCTQCHQAQFDDWSQSPHALAATNPPFEASFNHVHDTIGSDEAVSCLQCHAPLDSIGASLDENGRIVADSLAIWGISCAACHLGNGEVLTPMLGVIPQNPHDEALWTRRPSNADFCGDCHNPSHPLMAELEPDFGFTIPAGNPYREWLQGPYSEEQSEQYRTCIDCHGQNGAGTVHNWPGGTMERVKSAYTVTLNTFESSGGMLSGGVKITNTGCGHALPTGDPGHMLVFVFSIVNPEGVALFTEEYRLVGDMGGRAEPFPGESDTRLKPGESVEIRLVAPLAADAIGNTDALKLRYKATYSREPVIASYLNSIGVISEPVLIEETETELPTSG